MNKFLKPVLAAFLISVTAYFVWTGTSAGVPDGYLHQASTNHAGGMLIAKVSGKSATRLLVNGLESLNGFFDAAPIPASAIRDQQDQVAQVIFHAIKDGEALAGVGLATISGNEGIVRFDYGPPGSLSNMISGQNEAGPSSGPRKPVVASAQNWRRIPYPDGSGQISLPEGWNIGYSMKGQVYAEGPHGIVNKGLELPVQTPEGVAFQASIGVQQGSNQYVGNPTDPANAMREIISQMSMHSGVQWQVTRVREVSGYPVAYPLTQAAFIDNDQINAGRPLRCLTHVILSTVISNSYWTYFHSNVCSSPNAFAENLPVLMQIWKSAETSPQEIQSRWDNALTNMREIGNILDAGHASRAMGMERAQAPLVESAQSRRIIEDIATGQQANVELAYSSEIVNAMNAQRGYQAYREIPRSEWVSR